MLLLLIRAAEYIDAMELRDENVQRKNRVRADSRRSCQKARVHHRTARKQAVQTGDIIKIASRVWSDHRGAPTDQLGYVVRVTHSKIEFVVLSGVNKTLARSIVAELREFVHVYRGRSLKQWGDIIRLLMTMRGLKPACLPEIQKYIGLRMSFIVGMNWCGYTKRAIDAKPHWKAFMLDDHVDAVKSLEWLQRRYKYHYVPFVFVNGTFQPTGSQSLM